MYELEKENLKRCSAYIVTILRPSYIKGFMTTYLPPVIVQEILSQELSSVTLAAELLLQHILTLDENGWFQEFLDVLEAQGYIGLNEAIKKWDFEQIEKLEPFKKFLELIEPSFIKNVKAVEIIIYMRECLFDQDCEEIQRLSNIAGAQKLVECLKRTDKINSFKLLKLALEECNCDIVLDLLDPEDTGDKKKVKDQEGNGTESSFRIEIREEAEENNLSENHCKASGAHDVEHTAECAGKKLRKYQEELAGPAFRGENTIICAPTGCGKTIVALAICDHHLKNKKEGQKRKIAFMATRVEVYEQQYSLFQQHFADADEDVSVTGLCGESAEGVPVGLYIETNDIIVLTPQILVNALRCGTIASLSMFSLLIFDECHNTTGKHPYNVLMTMYLDSKLGNNNELLPQIVGLTASVGVGSFKSEREAENNICQLCAFMDVRVISTVTENKEELKSHIHVPEKQFFFVEKRSGDPFTMTVYGIMSKIEKLAKEVYNIDSLSNIKNRDYGSQKYEQWIVDVQKKCRTLQLEDKQKESQICRELFNYTEHLRKYNDALIINEDARTKDALDYLDTFFADVRNAGFDKTEQLLTQIFEDNYQQLHQLSTEESRENPKLKELKFILDEEYRNNEQTRTVLFVRTRALAEALKNWVEENPSLAHLKPGVLIGRGKRSQQTGMTLPSKKGLLESFKKNDQSKILIATSVADEGIDIPQCNLVLLYEYVGNVVKMIQVRGRGRAQGSKCILVSSKKEQIEKEKLNMLREKIVDQAVINLQQPGNTMLTKIEVLQREDKNVRDYNRLTLQRVRTEDCFRLLCSKCKSPACFTDNIRVLQDSHHVVLDNAFSVCYITKPHGRPRSYGGFQKKLKMFCKTCEHDWGIIASYMTIEHLPVIKIDSFVAENCVTKEQHYFRKWRDVIFTMKQFDIAEMHTRLHALQE
ncbi:antiviral innate immune response receptor RIG-I-like [Acipenser oxyrinchus oxyrinchus]|uniref:RNA helicase n=1 Tax=Acipenser oxyrinchus oxyrinchus TaxID=40147 RepID=A0AAD8GIB2_ACIOX|nr:antiviral innate immune response receptor RIG-I-like [Acipenser oxyrinchus oxyrinchus]